MMRLNPTVVVLKQGYRVDARAKVKASQSNRSGFETRSQAGDAGT